MNNDPGNPKIVSVGDLCPGKFAGRSGFTLLEVVLAVSLSILIVAAIAGAIHLNVTVLQRQQVRIEQAQVARNVLFMMANDLRAAFQYKPADVTGLDELAVSQAQIAGIGSGADLSETDTSQIDTGGLDTGGLDPGSLDPGSLDGGSNNSGGNGSQAPFELPDSGAAASGGGSADSGGGQAAPATSSANSTANQNIASGPTSELRPGLYGNSTELMIDISRLPRIDQYSPVVLGTSGPVSLPTDLKTISYFLSAESMETDAMQTGLSVSSGGGLYRRELDRAVAAFNLDVAGMLAREGYTQLIANEVVAMEFRYFNGREFQTEWDSDAEGGFPAAVEITIVVDPQRQLRETGQAGTLLAELRAYRSVVYLPIAEILPEEELFPPTLPAAGGGP